MAGCEALKFFKTNKTLKRNSVVQGLVHASALPPPPLQKELLIFNQY